MPTALAAPSHMSSRFALSSGAIFIAKIALVGPRFNFNEILFGMNGVEASRYHRKCSYG